MNGKKARRLRNVAYRLTVGQPPQVTRQLYKNLKKIDKRRV